MEEVIDAFVYLLQTDNIFALLRCFVTCERFCRTLENSLSLLYHKHVLCPPKPTHISMYLKRGLLIMHVVNHRYAIPFTDRIIVSCATHRSHGTRVEARLTAGSSGSTLAIPPDLGTWAAGEAAAWTGTGSQPNSRTDVIHRPCCVLGQPCLPTEPCTVLHLHQKNEFNVL